MTDDLSGETPKHDAHAHTLSADEALARLKMGNIAYVRGTANLGDTSALRRQVLVSGQEPYAVIVTCSDSRVIPEAIFSAGLGSLFVVRVAGNVVTDDVLGSVQYAVKHLGTQLVVVMGHTHCGAVHAALERDAAGYARMLTDAIHLAVGDEKDEARASRLNARYGVNRITACLADVLEQHPDVRVIEALYDIETGLVEF